MGEKIPGLEQLQALVDQGENIVFFGGAGVSTESGIPDFRGQDGLYRQQWAYPPEEIISHSFFMARPEEFYRFYRQKMLWPQAKPNAAHLALARLEEAGKLRWVITQNIDGLHQAAGSRRVLELHGSVLRNYCMDCGRQYPLEFILESQGVPRCSCGGLVRPDVVLYEEPLDQRVLRQAAEAVAEADLVMVGGTSLGVWPAAGLLDCRRGGRLVLINKSPTPRDAQADLLIQAPIGQVLGSLRLGKMD